MCTGILLLVYLEHLVTATPMPYTIRKACSHITQNRRDMYKPPGEPRDIVCGTRVMYLRVYTGKAERHLKGIAPNVPSSAANLLTHAVYHSKGLLAHYPERSRHERGDG